MFPKPGLRLAIKPPNTHRTGSDTIVAPFRWKKDISGHVSGFEIYFLQTEPYHSLQHVLVLCPTVHSSGLTVDPKHAVGLWSCSLREEHPTVSALKSTAMSAYHKILTCTCFLAKCPHNSNTIPPNVKPYFGMYLSYTGSRWRILGNEYILTFRY